MSHRTPSTQDNRNLLIAVLICALIFLGFEYFRLQSQQDVTAIHTKEAAHAAAGTAEAGLGQNISPGAPAKALGVKQNYVASEAAPTLPIQSATLNGRIALKGGRIDALTLPQFFEEIGTEDPVTFFNPTGEKVFFYEAGWLAENLETPDGNTLWQGYDKKLTPNKPLTIEWQSADGLLFQRQYTLHPESYSVQVTDGVSNKTAKPIAIAHYAQLHKGLSPEAAKKTYAQSTYTHFVGPEAIADSAHKTFDYEDLIESKENTFDMTEGWAGISTPYFIGALIPDQHEGKKNVTFRHTALRGKSFFSVDVQSPVLEVAPGGYVEKTYTLYTGPKQIDVLQKHAAGLERAVDFGWYHIIAKMFFDVVMWFYSLVGNLGVAVILVTILIKIGLWPLSAKSYVAMSKMKKLQPKMLQLKEKHGDNRQAMSMEMMALYREHKVNPLSGCWPILIQVPIFFAFYKMILISFEFRHAPFVGWITDLSARDPYFVLPLIMGITMLVQQKLNPAPADPVQEKVMKIMPVMFTIVFAMFPAGLVLYWTVNNILSVAQQYFVMRRLGVE